MSLVEKVKEFISKTGLFQSDLAKKIGVSEAAISQWMQGGYKGNVKNLEKKILQFIDLECEKISQAVPNLGFVETSVASLVFTAASLCQQDYEIGICYGGSGLGKTTAIKEYAKRNIGVVVLEPDEDCPSRDIIEELYEKLKLSGAASPRQKKKEILAKLKDSGWLVVVDEGENLKTSCFKTLRKLHDKSEYTFGLLFVGTERLYLNLTRLRGDFEYLTNRIGYCFKLKKLEQKDVQLMVNSLIKDDEDIWKIFYERTNGNARILSKTLKRSLKLANLNNVKINEEVIQKSQSVLIV